MTLHLYKKGISAHFVFINKSDKYSGDSPLRALKTTVLPSVSIKSWIVFSPKVFRIDLELAS